MKKFKNLNDYLDEISHYLVVKKGKNEILEEIKSHILEKAEQEFGKATNESIEKIIADYGKPRKIAEKYQEDYQLIAPSFKNHLFLYTGILFTIHYGLTILGFFTGFYLQLFPFFIIPKMENIFDLIGLLPMTLIFDVGLVGIILYIVTQEKKDIKLPWPKIFKKQKKRVDIKQPKMIYLIIMAIAFCVVVFVYLRFGTLFFLSFNPENVKLLFKQPAATIFSLFVISLFVIEIISYIIRFYKNELIYWLEFSKNCLYLLVLWFIFNYPVKNALAVSKDTAFLLTKLINSFILGLAFIIVLDTLSVIVKIFRQTRNRNRESS